MFEQQPEPERWLPLRDACRLLHVNEATLRQWADNGYLRVYRTPGGHRRFWSSDVLSLTDDGAPAGIRGTDNGLEGSALRHIRRRLHGDTVARQPWYQSVEEEGRDRMRLFGRRLLSLLVQESPLRRQRQEALAESHILGKEYGSEMAERGVTLINSLEAFVFFRSMVLESMEPKTWAKVLELADRVMVGLAESYQKHSS